MARRGPLAIAVLIGTLAWGLLPSAPAPAQEPVDFYVLEGIAEWPDGDLNVLIVPPEHGPIANSDTGILNNVNEVGPNNTYVAAVEDGVNAWDDAVSAFGTDWLEETYNPSVFVLGRDSVPTDVLMNPDILVITDEDEGPLLGTAYRLFPCVVRMSKTELFSLSYADMYNVTTQEYGHCLGLLHVGEQAGVDPLSDLKEPEHDVMNGFYTHPIGEPGTHLHCISNLDILALEQSLAVAFNGYFWGSAPGGKVVMSPTAYGDTCLAPPIDWREMTPPPFDYGTYPVESAVRAPAANGVLQSKAFKRVVGTADASDATSYAVEVGLARIGPAGECQWLDVETEAFVARDCYSPIWSPATGSDRWSWKVPARLKAGRYRVVSRVVAIFNSHDEAKESCCWAASNVRDFMLSR